MDMPPPPPPPPNRPVPPAPPRPELLAPTGRTAPQTTPMMDFFQKRLESLERDLAVERERASSAQALLHQQEALKAEVDSHLKSLTDQLRREKNEKEGAESASRAAGRVEALERRLDEMNATFATLLKEAVSRQSPGAAIVPVEALGAELTVFRRTIKDVMEQVQRWREEMRGLPDIVPEIRAVAARIPEDERRFEELIERRLAELSNKLAGTLGDWERRHEAELRRQDDRLKSLVDERAAMARLWEEQGGAIRAEFLKERIHRETEVSDQVATLAKKLDEAGRAQQESAAGAAGMRESLDRVVKILTQTPKAKDEVIVELEAEKAALVKAMRERRDELVRFAEDRRAVEKSMGDSLVELTGELEKERARTRSAEARANAAAGGVEALKARVEDLERSLAERDSRSLSLSAERDELTRSLVAESEKVRAAVEARTASDERWHQRLLELQRKVEDETARASAESASTGDLRAKIATMSEHMARAFQERDAVVARFADWERERQRYMDALKQKDGMITMLSTAFQGALKKP